MWHFQTFSNILYPHVSHGTSENTALVPGLLPVRDKSPTSSPGAWAYLIAGLHGVLMSSCKRMFSHASLTGDASLPPDVRMFLNQLFQVSDTLLCHILPFCGKGGQSISIFGGGSHTVVCLATPPAEA